MRLKTTIAALALGCSACGPGAPDPGPTAECRASLREVPNEGWDHYVEGTELPYTSNPPASGPHYPRWARYQRHEQPVPRGYWIHNVEHGAIVLLHRPDVPAATLEALVAFYESMPVDEACSHRRALLAPDPQLPRAIAAVAADFVLEADCVPVDALEDFVASRRGRGPENVCSDGTYP